MYMANTSPNARGPNAAYIPPARVVGCMGRWALGWVNLGSRWVDRESRWVREGF